MAEPLNPTNLLPALPVARNEAEFRRMTPEQKATLIAQWQEFWLGSPTPAVNGASGVSFPAIAIEQQPTAPNPELETWKGPAPTREERKAMENDDWK